MKYNKKDIIVIENTVNSIIKDAIDIERTKPKEAFKLASEAYSLSKELDYKTGIAQSLLRMGRSSWLFGELESAAVYLFDAIEIIQDIGNKEFEVEALNALGNIYVDFHNFDKALEYYIDALKYAREIAYKGMEATIRNNIGEIYKELEGYEKALEYYLESIRIYELLGERKTMGIPFLNIGMVYYYLKDYDKSLKYNELSLEIFNEYKDRIGEGYSLQQLGKVYESLDNYQLSLDYFQKSLRIAQETENKFHEIEILVDLHKLLLNMGDTNKAILYLKKALEISETRKAYAISAEICSFLASIYEDNQKYKKALYYYKKFHDTEKLSSNNDLQQKLKNITVQFKMEKAQNEKEIYRLRNVELKEKTEQLEKAYENIKIISKIGQSIISTLDLDIILNTVYENVNNIMAAECFGVGIFHEKSNLIEFKLFIDQGERLLPWAIDADNKKSLAAWCIDNKQEVVINDIDTDFNNYLEGEYDLLFGKRPESLIYYPLIVENSVIGMITVQSYRKNAYSNNEVDMIRALGSYIGIAIRNAQRAEKLSDLSQLDGLTEIPNRRRFDEVLRVEWTRAMRYSYPVSLLFIDIDYFKKYNDNYGHLSGDNVIKKVAKALVDSTKRATDFIGRYGGDEFIAILPDTDKNGAYLVAEEMRRNIEGLKLEHRFSEISKYVTITIGTATIVPCEYDQWSKLFNIADEALYLAKEKGRNNVKSLYV